jgi:hypothetical protein
LLSMSLPSCHPPPPRRREQVASVCLRPALLPSPVHRGFGLRILSCRGHFWVHSRYGPMTRSPSPGWFCRLASSVSFPPRRQPKLRGSDSCPGGTHLPLNMPAFRWTHYGPETGMGSVEPSGNVCYLECNRFLCFERSGGFPSERRFTRGTGFQGFFDLVHGLQLNRRGTSERIKSSSEKSR